jgi:hypothetical protein
LFCTLADTKNRSSAQVKAVMSLKFVECAITRKKVKRKADTEDYMYAGMQINGRTVGD